MADKSGWKHYKTFSSKKVGKGSWIIKPIKSCSNNENDDSKRWIYCKYCYKKVQPIISEESIGKLKQKRIVCSICGHGIKILTPHIKGNHILTESA